MMLLTRLSASLVILIVCTSQCSCFTPNLVYNKDGRSMETVVPNPYQYYIADGNDGAETPVEQYQEEPITVDATKKTHDVDNKTPSYQTISVNIPQGLLAEGTSWALVPLTDSNRRNLHLQDNTADGSMITAMVHNDLQHSLFPLPLEHHHQEENYSYMKPFGRNSMIPIPGKYSKEVSFFLNLVVQKLIFTMETVFGGVIFFVASTGATMLLTKILKAFVHEDSIKEALGTDNFMKVLIKSVDMYDGIVASEMT